MKELLLLSLLDVAKKREYIALCSFFLTATKVKSKLKSGSTSTGEVVGVVVLIIMYVC